jgi:hypothetical protein
MTEESLSNVLIIGLILFAFVWIDYLRNRHKSAPSDADLAAKIIETEELSGLPESALKSPTVH